jgi:hypothetical protein
MNRDFRPYFNGEWRAPSSDSVAYICVRVTKEPRTDGSVTVFLPSGTALTVRASDLLRFDPEPAAATTLDAIDSVSLLGASV